MTDKHTNDPCPSYHNYLMDAFLSVRLAVTVCRKSGQDSLAKIVHSIAEAIEGLHELRFKEKEE